MATPALFATGRTSLDQSSYGSSISPLITLDRATDVLRVVLADSTDPGAAEIDDEEVVVFRSLADGTVLSFDIPHFATYWLGHLTELVDHLATYSPHSEDALQSSFFARSTTTPDISLQAAVA